MKKYFEVFFQFLLLGCISFGGPVAHLGYFHHQFIDKLKWLNQESYARIIALSQFLPGPGSSQAGFAIGYHRAGVGGGFAAFLGFTLPSFLLMYAFALVHESFQRDPIFISMLHGLKLLTAVVVADACLKMFLKFCTHTWTRVLFALSTIILLSISSLFIQISVLIAAALIGSYFQSAFNQTNDNTAATKANSQENTKAQSFKFENIILAVFFIGLASAFLFGLLANKSNGEYSLSLLFADFYQAGSLVFGGGHVVLPLLQEFFGSHVNDQQFLSGYAAAQAVPGPMFSFASFLGASLTPSQALVGAFIACAGIFLPGFLLVIGLYNRWEFLAQRPRVASAVAAVNAAVVGLLFSALYQPIFTSSIKGVSDLLLIIIGWAVLYFLRIHIVFLVLAFSLGFGAIEFLI